MDAGKIIIGLLVCLILLFTIVTGTYMLLPLQSKMALDDIGRIYQAEVLLTEGLSMDQEKSLMLELERIGLKNIVIQCPKEGTLKRGEVGMLLIRGVLMTKVPADFLQFKDEKLSYEYKGRLFGRRISN